ncbi:MAG: hypothetical protein WA118_01690 [Carboxydocellales bacterium]
MSLILGIDTSNYTTSVALVNDRGHLVVQERKLLQVGEGERGLQQSAAVFQHLTRLPELLTKLWTQVSGGEQGGKLREQIKLITVSTRPRPQQGSYMPVFRVGEGYAKTLANALEIPLLETTHQEGHLMAGLWSAGGPQGQEFLAVHLSGGTTELLKVHHLSKAQHLPKAQHQSKAATMEKTTTPTFSQDFFQIELLGGTQDLHAGQFVDRVGVALGLEFPAGPRLEQLAQQAEASKLTIPSSVQGMSISFSGPESQAQRFIAEGKPPAEIARAVEKCIALSLEKLLLQALQNYGLREMLIVGGVAANQYIRTRLSQKLEHPAVKAKLYFAEPVYSSDNAVGVALLGREYVLRAK